MAADANLLQWIAVTLLQYCPGWIQNTLMVQMQQIGLLREKRQGSLKPFPLPSIFSPRDFYRFSAPVAYNNLFQKLCSSFSINNLFC